MNNRKHVVLFNWLRIKMCVFFSVQLDFYSEWVSPRSPYCAAFSSCCEQTNTLVWILNRQKIPAFREKKRNNLCECFFVRHATKVFLTTSVNRRLSKLLIYCGSLTEEDPDFYLSSHWLKHLKCTDNYRAPHTVTIYKMFFVTSV